MAKFSISPAEVEKLKNSTLGDILDRTVAKYPDHDAIVYADRGYRQTWQEFAKQVDAFAKGLLALGIKAGDKVAVWATNVPWWVALQFATAKIGAILLTVNTNYRRHEILYLLQHSECETLFLIDTVRDHNFVKTLYDIAPELKYQARDNIQCKELPHLKRVCYLGAEKHLGMFSVPEIIGMGEHIDAELYLKRKAAVKPDDVVNMQYTSGTTGFPKGVLLTHAGIGFNGFCIGENMKFTAEDRLCLCVPLFHCFGCVLGTIVCVTHGSCLVIVENFNPLAVLNAIESERCTVLYGVPTMFLAELEHKNFHKFDLTSLRTGVMAGSVCPEPLMRRVIKDMHLKEITSCYGLTEASPVMSQSHVDDPLEKRCTTVGKAMPEVEVRIVDPKTNQELPQGEEGEVVCRGYNVMHGYYKMPEATDKAIDQDKWLHSGDLGYFDAEGYLHISGRITDMIVRGGENVYPKEIENFLLEMPGILDIQIVAVPSRRYGEDVAAFILPDKEAKISPEAVRAFCRGKIAWYKIPRHIHLVTEFPLTASGKVQKFKLRQMAAELWPDL